MKNYQVIPVNDITIDIDFGNETVSDVKVIALAFHEGADGELKIKAITKYDLIEGSVSCTFGDYDLIEMVNKFEVKIK